MTNCNYPANIYPSVGLEKFGQLKDINFPTAIGSFCPDPLQQYAIQWSDDTGCGCKPWTLVPVLGGSICDEVLECLELLPGFANNTLLSVNGVGNVVWTNDVIAIICEEVQGCLESLPGFANNTLLSIDSGGNMVWTDDILAIVCEEVQGCIQALPGFAPNTIFTVDTNGDFLFTDNLGVIICEEVEACIQALPGFAPNTAFIADDSGNLFWAGAWNIMTEVGPSYTILPTDVLNYAKGLIFRIAPLPAADVTITLPAASTLPIGSIIKIKDVLGYSITQTLLVLPDIADLIDGQGFFVFTGTYQSVEFINVSATEREAY